MTLGFAVFVNVSNLSNVIRKILSSRNKQVNHWQKFVFLKFFII